MLIIEASNRSRKKFICKLVYKFTSASLDRRFTSKSTNSETFCSSFRESFGHFGTRDGFRFFAADNRTEIGFGSVRSRPLECPLGRKVSVSVSVARPDNSEKTLTSGESCRIGKRVSFLNIGTRPIFQM